jgi:cobalt-zinc-cadmium efflux system outer membrane protein
MITTAKSLTLVAVLPLAFTGCTSTNPKAAFDDTGKQVSARSGHEIRWMRDDDAQKEIEQAVDTLLQTNLTAQTAVSVALLNNRTLQAEFEEIGISQADLAQASRLRNPTYSGFFRVPTHGPSVLNAENNLAQDFLDLLTLPTRKKIAAQNLEQTKLRAAHEVLRLSQEVQTAFFTLQAHQQFVKRLNIIVEVNEAAADLAQRQFDAGNINELELHNQRTVHAQSRLDLATAEARTRVDREKVNRLLGLWGRQTAWQAADELPPLPLKEIPLENLEALAVSQRLDLSAARSEVQSVLSALKLKKSVRFVPAVSLGVSTEQDLDHSWVVGPTLDMEIPIFDQGQAGVARLEAQYRKVEHNFEALAVNIRSEVRETRDAFIAARDAAEYHEKILLPQRQQILRETLLHYNAMQKSNFELLLSKEREQLAEREAIEALRDYWIARAELERAVGGNLTRDIPAMPVQAKTDSMSQEEHHHNH